jgi:hypothetical protein
VKKLISQNIANHKARIENPHPDISIFNFHYAAPPDTVAMNYHLNRVIGDNETGFRGTQDAPYRMEAWDFILAGGGLFNHLDYSFTADHPRGTWTTYPTNQPGGGNPTLRRQFRILRDFIADFDFVKMRPDNAIIRGGVPAGMTARALVQPDRACALYLRPSGVSRSRGPVALELNLPPGRYRAEWLNPLTGKVDQQETFRHSAGTRVLTAPAFTEDIALGLRRVGS